VDPQESIFTRRFDRLVHYALVVVGASVLLAATFGLWALWPSNQAVGYQPEQPVRFPHDIMAGQVKIPCLLCHSTAETGPTAGLPPVELCIACHRYVQPRDDRGALRPMIAAFLSQYVDPETGAPLKPIVWQKVHDVSDFAYFDHSRHTVGAKLECSECHGPVETMREVRRVNSLKMGWCIDCHRGPPDAWRTDGRETRGPYDCYTCHR
jgi:hypothetical protein